MTKANRILLLLTLIPSLALPAFDAQTQASDADYIDGIVSNGEGNDNGFSGWVITTNGTSAIAIANATAVGGASAMNSAGNKCFHVTASGGSPNGIMSLTQTAPGLGGTPGTKLQVWMQDLSTAGFPYSGLELRSSGFFMGAVRKASDGDWEVVANFSNIDTNVPASNATRVLITLISTTQYRVELFNSAGTGLYDSGTVNYFFNEDRTVNEINLRAVADFSTGQDAAGLFNFLVADYSGTLPVELDAFTVD